MKTSQEQEQLQHCMRECSHAGMSDDQGMTGSKQDVNDRSKYNIKATQITEVNLPIFAYRLFHEYFSPIVETNLDLNLFR